MESYQSVYDGKELDQVNANVAFEEYEALIEKLRNSITYQLKLQLRETLADKAELTAIESENIKREGKGFRKSDWLLKGIGVVGENENLGSLKYESFAEVGKNRAKLEIAD